MSDRPQVWINLAPSLDGKLAQARKRARFVMSRHSEDPRRMDALRARADALITGATNVRADDPDMLPSRLRVVVTHDGEHLSPSAKFFDRSAGGEPIVAHAASMPAATRKTLGAAATLVELGATSVDVRALLEWLARERGCRTVICEGGGVMNAAFFAARAVDVLYLTIVPRILGGASAPSIVSGLGFEPDEIPDGRLVSCEQIGDELFLEYRLSWGVS